MHDLSPRKKILAAIGLAAVLVAGAGYGFYSYRRTIRDLKASIASANAELLAQKDASAAGFKELAGIISKLENSNSALSDSLLSEKEKNDLVARQVGAVSSSVGDLEKLSHTDPQLLEKYSKVYFLNENYVPVSLANIDPKYVNSPSAQPEYLAQAYPYLEKLLAQAASEGLDLQIDSAYRSFGTQAVLKQSYRVVYGAGTANSFSAEQGYSEHQLGTAVDFTTPKIGGGLSGFDKTPEYAWLLANAYRYGFVISYPENNPSYQFEPWHWRFVGVQLATYVHSQNTYFYNLDQRIINTYLADIFD